MSVSFSDIEAADRLLEGRIVRTPFLRSETLSAISGAELFLKFENRQYTASFKDRGAYIYLAELDEAQRQAGVIALSAGNHAQGVAYHAKRMGVPATIVMPEATPFSKVRAAEFLGAEVILRGETISEGETFIHERAEAEGLTFVHPYDDARIVAGQGTVGLEMLRAVPGLDFLVVPVGGGGLIAGIALAAKALSPETRVIGVEATGYPSMHHALRGLAPPPGGLTIAEGIAVKRPGALTLPLVRELVEDILLVDEAAMEQGVQLLAEIEKTVAEGAGAAALAAVLSHPERFRGRRVGLVVSGGNIDARLLASVLMRGLVRGGRLVRLRIEIQDQPGGLARATAAIARAGGNIVEVQHQRWFEDVPIKLTDIEVALETRDEAHVGQVLEALQAAGMHAVRLSSRSI